MPLPAAIPLVIMGLAALKGKAGAKRAGERKSTSHRERHPAATATRSQGPASEILLTAVGIPYSYGAGSPATPWGKMARGLAGGWGLDCSGFAQAALAKFRRLPRNAPDRSASQLAAASKPVAWGKQRPLDLAFYGRPISHVMIVLSLPDKSGDSEVIGESGGRSSTNGDNPKAAVKVFSSARYRKDFIRFGRI
jgi:cell wall-associated NlpC family hydrolase